MDTRRHSSPAARAIWRTAAEALALAAVVTAVSAVPASADTTSAEALIALREAAPDVLSTAAAVPVAASGADPVQTATAQGTVAVADDPAQGVRMDPAATAPVTVGLPGAATAGDAVAVTPGTVAYDNGTSNNVVAATPDGVAVLATLNSAAAPERYDYPLTLSPGQQIQGTDDGGFLVLGADGKTIALIVPPAWAKDAQQRPVPAHYELAGNTVTMVVAHHGDQVTYPVVADPRFQFSWSGVTVYLNRNETKSAIQWGSWALGFLPAGRVAFILAAVVGSPPVQNVAAWVVDRGYCLGITQRYGTAQALPFVYRC
ncbi:hypothetical protein [Amycolatopsis sp. cmx-4-68]|uniref:hypothetical protein n=1 Tax=Amycolatopsis sp. cmx-4-68 TaxID=2790938 RepID=UPI00397DB86D